MTKEEFTQLKTGDLIENKKSGSRYVIVDRRSTEPITQIAKEDIRTRTEEFNVLMRTLSNVND